MKTTISQLAAITLFAILILVGTVKAEGKELSALNHKNIETSLELENWMVNDYFWKIDATIVLEEVKEASLVLENWMTDDTTWKVGNAIKLEAETEQTLPFESWMTDENIWNR